MLDYVFWGNSIQSWLVAIALIVGALIVGRVASLLIMSIARRLKSGIGEGIAEGAPGPLTTLVMIFGVRLATESLELQAGIKGLVENGTTFFSVVIITWFAANVYDAVHRGVFVPYAKRPETSVDLHIFVVLRTIVNVVLWMMGLASALNSVGFEVSAILAGLGIGGMALALASQDTVANVFGGVLVLTQRPFKIGDRIEIESVNGWVHQFGLRNTVIKNWYGREVIIPNKKFTDSVVVNIDSQSVYYQEARLRLDPRASAADVERALEILREVVRDVDLVDKTPWIMFDKIDHGFFELEFWYAIPRWSSKEIAVIPNEYEKICRAKSAVNLEILKRFEAAGIRLAVPIELHVGISDASSARPPLSISRES